MPDRIERKILHDIARVGWSLIGVGQDEEGPGFVYSIGMMHTFAHPEIIMFGLDLSTMMTILNVIGDEIRSGRPFKEAGLYDGVLAHFACKITPVAECHHEQYLGCAQWHRRHLGATGGLLAVQCLWPDRNGRFPDEPGCDPAVTKLQPRLCYA